MKRCATCKEIKELDNFSKDKYASDGMRHSCKLCLHNKRVVRKSLLTIDEIQKIREHNRLRAINRRNNLSPSDKEKQLLNRRNISISRDQILQRRKVSRKSQIKHKERRLFDAAKHRALTNNIEFNITIDDIVIPYICPVLGISICKTNTRIEDNSPTIDRIDPNKGYVKGNICVISYRANRIKSNGKYQEFLLVSEYVKKKSIDNDDYSI